MRYYKIIQDSNVIGVGCNFLRWLTRSHMFGYCEMEQAECVKDVVGEKLYHDGWLKNVPEIGEAMVLAATVVLIQQEEYDELYEMLMDGEVVPEPDPEPEPTPQPEPEPDILPRASKTISKGEYFYIGRKLCKAIVDIANGAYLTLNTNYLVTTMENVLTLLDS